MEEGELIKKRQPKEVRRFLFSNNEGIPFAVARMYYSIIRLLNLCNARDSALTRRGIFKIQGLIMAQRDDHRS